MAVAQPLRFYSSQTVNSLPSDGSTVYATWYYFLNGNWVYNEYSYTAFGAGAQKGVITSPAPTSTLTGSSVAFTWTAGAGATAYWIDAGSSAGGNQYFQSGNLGDVLTKTVTGLPTNGSMVYVTLYSLVNGQWLNNQYTYTAYNTSSALGVMQTPTARIDAERERRHLHLEPGFRRHGVLDGCGQHGGR